MIDMLVLRCPIRDDILVSYNKFGVPVITDTTDYLRLESLELPLEASIDAQGNTSNLRHAWESIPSSYGSLAMKVFDFRDTKHNQLFVEIKASPAKIMQGHNVYGSDDLRLCAESLLNTLYMAYPTLAGYFAHEAWSVSQIDITYHSKTETELQATQFIDALQNLSNGQTRSRTGYSGTAYFGQKNSRIKKIKIYDKFKEVLAFLDKEKKKPDSNLLPVYTAELLNYTKCMVRWEVSIKSRWLQRRDLPTNLFKLIKKFKPQQFWQEAMNDIFKALEGKEMRIIKDENIRKQLQDKFYTVNKKTGLISYGRADSCYRTYRSLKSEGWVESKNTITESTFYRHIQMLQQIGFSKLVLQNLKGEGLHSEVIPMLRYVNIDFTQQIPDFAPSHLRLVA